MIEEFAFSLFGGLCWAGLGYYQAVLADKEKFEPKKFAKSLVAGAITGAYVVYSNVDLGIAGSTVAGFMATPVLTKIFDSIWDTLKFSYEKLRKKPK